MQYFVTGATGFIGKRLVKTLLARRGSTVHFLLRQESAGKLDELHAYWELTGSAKARAVPVYGDLKGKKLGVSGEDLKRLKGQIDHVYHLAAVYDLSADEESQVAVNIEGTRNLVEFAKAVDAGHLHHVSSIAAAGLYEGVFREDMFDEAEGLDHPYFMTKHESEKIVRTECKLPWTVYRPALVVGDSATGEMDEIERALVAEAGDGVEGLRLERGGRQQQPYVEGRAVDRDVACRLRDAGLAERLTRAARALVAERYDAARVGEKFRLVVESAAAARSA